MITDNLLSSTKLTSTQKLLIAFVLRRLNNGKKQKYFDTNENTAKKLGWKLSLLETSITALNKTNFFKSAKNKHNNGKEIRINSEALNKFLADESIISAPKRIRKKSTHQPESKAEVTSNVEPIKKEEASTEIHIEQNETKKYYDSIEKTITLPMQIR